MAVFDLAETIFTTTLTILWPSSCKISSNKDYFRFNNEGPARQENDFAITKPIIVAHRRLKVKQGKFDTEQKGLMQYFRDFLLKVEGLK